MFFDYSVSTSFFFGYTQLQKEALQAVSSFTPNATLVMINKLVHKWRSYRYRFVPWIAWNLRNRSKREVKRGLEDKVVEDDVLLNALLKLLPRLQSVVGTNLPHFQVAKKNEKEVKEVLGFCVSRGPSKVSGAGKGVVVSAGNIDKGTLVALYPGTLYQPHEPILLPSLGNAFVLRCVDGIHIDGNDRWISKIVYRSCVSRDSIRPYQAADLTWLTAAPVMPLNIGQYVNNHNSEFPANVAYQELDLPLSAIEPHLRCFLPNIWYGGGGRQIYVRLVALVSISNIKQGEEVFSNYYTIVQ